MRANYTDAAGGQVEEFFDSAYSEITANGKQGLLDSASGMKDVTKGLIGSNELPDCVKAVIDITPDDSKHRVLDAAMTGMDVYRREHGCAPTADVIMAAMQQGLSAGFDLDRSGRRVGANGQVLDNVGSTAHHDQISSQPNRIVVAITSAIAEAVPFATYLPVDIGSNQAKLGIVSHLAGNTYGAYTANDIMDGINSGKAYISSERRVAVTLGGGNTTGAAAIYTTTGGSTTVPLLRGRTQVYINGFLAAAEASGNSNSTTSTSAISGTFNLAGTDYTIGGTVTIATGAIALTFSPALPGTPVVEAQGYIDYEANPALTPTIETFVSTFDLYANPWRVYQKQTIDSSTQYKNELGLDLQSESLIAIRNQFANERHYMALAKLKSLAANNVDTFDFAWATQGLQKERSQVWRDSMAIIGKMDQKMAEDTMDHGITHWYVGSAIAAQLIGLPSDMWEPSGVWARPGIYRLGKIYGRFDVYYVPGTAVVAANQILMVGRSTQVARCPIVMGDAVAPTYLPLAMLSDFKAGQGFYARNFTNVNPHIASAKGAALLTVSNLT